MRSASGPACGAVLCFAGGFVVGLCFTAGRPGRLLGCLLARHTVVVVWGRAWAGGWGLGAERGGRGGAGGGSGRTKDLMANG
jgi:hypothetical protein